MDLIGNLFSKLKQAGLSKKISIYVERSDLVLEILTVLYKEGFIIGFRVIDNHFQVFLKYFEMRPVLYKFKRYSTFSKKSYYSVTKLVKVFRKSDFILLSTTSGIVTKEYALNYNLGGEVLVKLN